MICVCVYMHTQVCGAGGLSLWKAECDALFIEVEYPAELGAQILGLAVS